MIPVDKVHMKADFGHSDLCELLFVTSLATQ